MIKNSKKFPFDWGATVTQRPTQQTLHELTEGNPGVVLLALDGNASFVPEENLTNALTDGANDDLREIAEQFAVAKRVPNGYDPHKDVVVGFRGTDGPLERLTNKQTIRSRAWWIKPASRSIRRINLAETEAVVAHMAFEL